MNPILFANFAFCISTAFFIGSFPTGFILVRILSGKDIREHGSGNIGATNVSRVLGKKWAVVAFLIDAFKGYIPVFLFKNSLSDSTLLLSATGFAAVVGHCYCPWLRWNGGKGVAVGEGVLFAVVPLAAVLGMVTYVVFAAVFRISAIGSLAGLLSTLIYVLYTQPRWAPLLTAVGGLLVWRHRSNIKQLLAKQSST